VQVLYVYAVTRPGAMPDCEGIDGRTAFASVSAGGVAALYSDVEEDQFSQEAIDVRAGDLEWLGAIGYRHQRVVSEVMKMTAVVPLRAFTLFSSAEALRSYLQENGEILARTLDRLDGKREWTLRIEFDPEKWSSALAGRVASLGALQREIESAAPGKAFLLRKKMDEEKKRASREAEQEVVSEIERTVVEKLSCETVAESRQARDGAFPQIDVLLDRDEESRLQELQAELAPRYEREGVTLAINGPWPPYTFAAL
jgi:gas vesicle protein GvpL/GvpF